MFEKFLKIDGTHPWRETGLDGYVDYPVRYRGGGHLIYFNFPLACELGLIPEGHPPKISKELEEAVLKTFSLQILNEHDWINKKRLPRDYLTERLYMATRYLQLQHESKRGETSGDGRSIWNGVVRTSTKVFDISSCGTGVTVLSPGVIEARKHLETGSNEYGYASGLACLDEMFGSAIMSEIFYREGLPTERCLAIIEYKDKSAIGVRTAPNLIRPAHIFRFLKMELYDETKKSFDYFLDRQIKNGVWKLPKKGKTRYLKALKKLAKMFAKLAAVMEEEYIFNWLAWDGDNILAHGAILDYGSIRQFAAKHNKYRYEDVDRFSTCLTEQKNEARYLIQTFAQVVYYIIHKDKKNIKDFDQDLILTVFDENFILERQRRSLYKMGFVKRHIDKLLVHHQEKVEEFRKVLNYFEHIKTSEGEKKVPDGIDHPPIFLVRHILRSYPIFLAQKFKGKDWPVMDPEKFCHIMTASYVGEDDLQLTDYRRQKSLEFQSLYTELVGLVSKQKKHTLKEMARRSTVINYEFRRTGDGITWIVNEAIRARNDLNRDRLIATIERFIQSQVLVPGKWKPIRSNEIKGSSMQARLLRKMHENLEIYNELI